MSSGSTSTRLPRLPLRDGTAKIKAFHTRDDISRWTMPNIGGDEARLRWKQCSSWLMRRRYETRRWLLGERPRLFGLSVSSAHTTCTGSAALHALTIARKPLQTDALIIDQEVAIARVSGSRGRVTLGSSQPLPATFSNHPNLKCTYFLCTTTLLHLTCTHSQPPPPRTLPPRSAFLHISVSLTLRIPRPRGCPAASD
jgi:hypothetical protein